MISYERAEVIDLVKKVLLNHTVDDLKILIKSTETPHKKTEERPWAFERRARFEEGVVKVPETRLLRPQSRSRNDFWTILYHGKIAAKGEFHEIEKVLSSIPRDLYANTRLSTRHIALAIGIFALILLSLYGGILISETLGAAHHASGDVRVQTLSPVQAKELSDLRGASLELTERQETLKTMLGQVLANQSQRPGPAVAIATGLSAPTMEERYAHEMQEYDLRQLVQFEKEREDLRYKDRELELSGLMSAHRDRRTVASQTALLDQRISDLKRKLYR